MPHVNHWPRHLPVRQVRLVYPTTRMGEVRAFYGEVLGLRVLRAEGPDEEDGLHIGLPGRGYRLLFRSAPHPPPVAPASILVLALDTPDALPELQARLEAAGARPVPAPEYGEGAIRVQDPDGRMVVLMP